MNLVLVDDPELIERIGQSGSFGQRSEGLHVSEIYKRLMIRLDPKKYGGEIDSLALRRMEIGVLFENILEQGLREKYATERVGEIFSDPILSTDGERWVRIAMSPDGVNPTLVCGEEYKATFKSCRLGLLDEDGAPLLKFYAWFVQMKAYAKWLALSRFLLRVLFVNGDYRWHKFENCHQFGPCSRGVWCGGGPFPCGPLMKSYQVDFTDEEIDNNWEMLIRIAREEGLL